MPYGIPDYNIANDNNCDLSTYISVPGNLILEKSTEWQNLDDDRQGFSTFLIE
jgi:hypothetical protein